MTELLGRGGQDQNFSFWSVARDDQRGLARL
jgi:hypothetical protein